MAEDQAGEDSRGRITRGPHLQCPVIARGRRKAVSGVGVSGPLAVASLAVEEVQAPVERDALLPATEWCPDSAREEAHIEVNGCRHLVLEGENGLLVTRGRGGKQRNVVCSVQVECAMRIKIEPSAQHLFSDRRGISRARSLKPGVVTTLLAGV